jgi:uncharacterized protein YjbJ (UPF0337 family)
MRQDLEGLHVRHGTSRECTRAGASRNNKSITGSVPARDERRAPRRRHIPAVAELGAPQWRYGDTENAEENPMDWNRVEGNWKQVKGKIKEKWGQLTDDDLDTIGGRREQLEGKIQERYGLAKDQVRRDIDDWYASQRW